MKLTKLQKQAFVEAVMRDIPTENFQEEAKNLIQKLAIERCPPEIQKIWKSSALRGFLQTANIRLGDWGDFQSIAYVQWAGGFSEDSILKNIPEVKALVAKNTKQINSLLDMRAKLEAAMASVTTLKQAQELLPEFVDYLPKETEAPSKYAPAVIANLSADLMKLGWPKDKVKKILEGQPA